MVFFKMFCSVCAMPCTFLTESFHHGTKNYINGKLIISHGIALPEFGKSMLKNLSVNGYLLAEK